MISSGQPSLPDDDGSPSELGVNLVWDAISEFWDEGSTVDDDTDNPASSTFAILGFGDVYVDKLPSGVTPNIIIRFASLDPGILGVVSISVDPKTKTIISATIILTNRISVPGWYTLDDEDYKNIAAHELGHAIRLGHSGPPGTMMHTFADLTADAYMPLWGSSLNVLERLYGA